MSLAEFLNGSHWESECHSVTTGTGPLWIDDLTDRPSWAIIYLIIDKFSTVWEIGVAENFDIKGLPSQMNRRPILSSSGIGVIINFASGVKSIWFADAISVAMIRYIKRLEKDTQARTWETEQIRKKAWDRLRTVYQEEKP